MARLSRILMSTNVAEPPAAVNIERNLVIMSAALACSFIFALGLFLVARCAWFRRVRGSAASSSSLANKGVKKEDLQQLPKFTYSSGCGSSTAMFGSKDCVICLGEFVEGDEVRVLPQCGHGFHVACVDKWLESHSSCPSCRKILEVVRYKKSGLFHASTTTSSSSYGGEAATEVELSSIGEDSNANHAQDATLLA